MGPMPALARSDALRWLALPALALGAYVLATTAAGVVGHYRPVPFMDQWATVDELRAIQSGEYRLGSLFRQHNEHRLAVPRLLFFLDGWLTRQSGWLCVGASLLLQALHVALLVALVRAAGERRPAVLAAVTGALVVLLFSALQQQNFVEPFQVQFPLVYLAATTAVAAACLSPFAQRPWLMLAASLAAAVVASFSMASGLGVWCVLLVVAARVPLPFRALAAIAATSAIVIVFYLHGLWIADPYYLPPSQPDAIGLQRPHLSAVFLATYLGSPVRLPDGVHRAALGVAAGCLGALAFAGVAPAHWRRCQEREEAARQALLGVALFALGSALLTTYGRAAVWNLLITAERYATGAAFFWAALTLLAVVSVRGWRRTAALAVSGAAILATALPNAVHVQQDGRLRQAVHRGAIGMRLGITDLDEMGRFLTPDPVRDFRDFVPWLREHRHSLFRDGEWPLLGRPAALLGGPAGTCSGAIEALRICRGSGWAFAAKGWAFLADQGRSPARVFFTDENDVLLGYGVPQERRPEVEEVHPRAAGHNVGFHGYGIALTPETRVRLHVQVEDGRVFRVQGDCELGGAELAATPGEPVEGTAAQGTGDFSPVRIELLPGPPLDAAVSTDAGTGSWTCGPVLLQANQTLIVPVCTGECGFGLRIEVMDRETSESLCVLRPPPLRGEWRFWRCPLPPAARQRPLEVVAHDEGRYAGQHLAVGRPGWVLAPH